MAANFNRAETESPFLSSEAIGDPQASQVKRLLLVDNQAHVLRVMKLSLDRNGFVVDTALSAEVALQMMSEQYYDVVIADAELAQMKGRRLFEIVSEKPEKNPPLKLLLVDSGSFYDEAVLPEGVELQEKPISLRWLVVRLSEFFGHYDDDGSPEISELTLHQRASR